MWFFFFSDLAIRTHHWGGLLNFIHYLSVCLLRLQSWKAFEHEHSVCLAAAEQIDWRGKNLDSLNFCVFNPEWHHLVVAVLVWFAQVAVLYLKGCHTKPHAWDLCDNLVPKSTTLLNGNVLLNTLLNFIDGAGACALQNELPWKECCSDGLFTWKYFIVIDNHLICLIL